MDERGRERTLGRRELLRMGVGATCALPWAAALVGTATLSCDGAEQQYGPTTETPPAGQATGQGAAGRPGAEAPAAPQGQAQPGGQARPGGQAAPQAQPAPGGTAGQQLVTEVPEMDMLVDSLQYTNESPNPQQLCSNCRFYTAAGDQVGNCQLFPQGVVTAGGWCQSWAARQA